MLILHNEECDEQNSHITIFVCEKVLEKVDYPFNSLDASEVGKLLGLFS